MTYFLRNIRLYFYTIRHLKFKQVFYQLYYRLKRIFLKRDRKYKNRPFQVKQLLLQPSIAPAACYIGNNIFVFLNREKEFSEKIDWNFAGYGKLWAYNLNYFDFLNQEGFNDKDGLRLIDDFCENNRVLREGVEPYPISLRGINWIKFFSYRRISDKKYDAILFSHYQMLNSNLEYHLLGNHLLENGFSLLFAAIYFREMSFYKNAVGILQTELDAQILNDGAHFELSPMYHQLLLFRVLDCVNLIINNLRIKDPLLERLITSASRMLGWLDNVTFSNGDVPMVNDAAYGIAPSTSLLRGYAKELGISWQSVKLSGSGYRMIKSGPSELFIDVGNIGPDYIPGHAHSDTFSFVLHYGGEPLIVDSGTSTYERGERRIFERSTQSHNTVIVNGLDQSEVWSSFRVGRRAKIIHLRDGQNSVTASHDGYKFLGITHQRIWEWNGSGLRILDALVGKKKENQALALIHFHPNQVPILDKNTVFIGSFKIFFNGESKIELCDYDFAVGFNSTKKSKVARIYFNDRLETLINFPA